MIDDALLREFVSPEQPIDGLRNAEFGALAVILRNGRVVRLVKRGRFGRGWRAPLIGNLSVVQVNTGLIGIVMPIITIPTKDQYVISSVRIAVEVQIDDSDGYAAFQDMVDRIGPTFGRGLVAQLENGVEKLVRDELGRRTHAELYGRPLAGYLKANEIPFPIGDGVLSVMHLVVEGVAWDPIYEQTRETAAQTTLVVAGVRDGQDAA